MKKALITVGLWAAMMAGAMAQTTPKTDTEEDYKKRKLKLEEINLVSSFYQQDGNNSAVTGGVGTESLWDVANSLDLKVSKYDRFGRQHTLNLDFSIDYYSSASSDKIDPRSISSASMTDLHIYPTLTWGVKNELARTNTSLSYSYSTEWDYKSNGFNFNFSKASKDNNRELSFKASAFFDTWMAILPAELRPLNYSSGAGGDQDNLDFKPRNSYALGVTFSQVINKNLQVSATIEPSYQEGLLSTPYHRVYFTNNTVTTERLPGSRVKLPIGLRANYFLGDRFIFKTFYRFYADDWGMVAHTANLEVPIKITPFFSVSPFYRFNTQSAVRYFRAYGQHDPNLLYHTSDYDISGFQSQFFGAGLRLAPPGGILGIKYFNSAEVRYGHFVRNTGSTGFLANIISLAIKVK